MEWPYKYFSQKEMSCRCGCGGVPKDSFMRDLETLRINFGKPLRINSGFRCSEYNRKVADSGANGPHTLGLAADIGIHGADALNLLTLVKGHGFTGVGVSQKGGTFSRFIHLDTCPNNERYPRPWIWSY